jgi:hypothetical protein
MEISEGGESADADEGISALARLAGHNKSGIVHSRGW